MNSQILHSNNFALTCFAAACAFIRYRVVGMGAAASVSSGLREGDEAFAIEQTRATRLGGGQFGAVLEATWHGERVAAKTFHQLRDPLRMGIDTQEQLDNVVSNIILNPRSASSASLHAAVAPSAAPPQSAPTAPRPPRVAPPPRHRSAAL